MSKGETAEILKFPKRHRGWGRLRAACNDLRDEASRQGESVAKFREAALALREETQALEVSLNKYRSQLKSARRKVERLGGSARRLDEIVG